MESHFKDKTHPIFAATMAQNFFNTNEIDDFYEPSAAASKSLIVPRKQPQRKRANRKKIQQDTKLLPAKQAQKIEIFQNTAKNNLVDIEEFEEIILETPKKKQVVSSIIETKSASKKHSRRRDSIKPPKKQFIQQQFPTSQNNKEIQQKPPSGQKRHKQEQYSFNFISPKQQKSVLNEQQPIVLPFKPMGSMFDDQDEPETQYEVLGSSECFDYDHEEELRKQIFAKVKANTTLKMQIIRDKGGFNRFWPQFHLRFADDKRQLMSAKKTSSRPASTFIISRSITDFQESSADYLGKVKSNILGDTYNIFGPGLNPSNAQQKKVIPRELLATLMYNTSLFYANGPRKFSIFVKEPQLQYYKDFPQVAMYKQEIPLNALYSYQSNKQQINLIFNKKPQYDQKNKTYFLDFKGKAPKTSVKNFILEQKEGGPEVLLFGKVSEDCFNCQISSNISPYIAFAVAIANFDNRLISQ